MTAATSGVFGYCCRHIFGGSARVAAGRKGKLARGKAAAAAADANNADEDAQQEVTVLMMQQLPTLLTTYQAEPVVVRSKPFRSPGVRLGVRNAELGGEEVGRKQCASTLPAMPCVQPNRFMATLFYPSVR